METANLLVLGSTMYWWVRGQGEKEEVILEDEAFQSPWIIFNLLSHFEALLSFGDNWRGDVLFLSRKMYRAIILINGN